MLLAALQIIAQQQIEDLHRALHVLGHDLDESARGGVHGRHPHHLRVVFAKTLGAVDGELLALQLFDDLGFLRVRVGKPRLILARDLIQGRFRDIHIALLNERRAKPVDHGQNQRADLVAVDVGIGADDDLVPAQVFQVKRGQILCLLRLHLHTAAEHADEVGDDIGLENAVIIGLQAV